MKINIIGEIIDNKYDGCFCPQDLKSLLEDVADTEPLEVEITSVGGSVFAGIQIANMLARHKGQVTTHGVGLVASIATVILMAGKKVVVDDNCFLLLHNPWTMVQGNANDLEKEIDTLNKCKTAMMGYYKKHAKVSENELDEILDAETWYLGKEFADVFDVEVLESDRQLDIAAKFDLSKFKTLPRGMNMENNTQAVTEEKDDEKTPVAETTTTEETKADETVVEEPTVEEPKDEDDEPTVEELKEEIEELTERVEALGQENEELKRQLAECGKPDEDKVSKDECEKRVSGM